MAVSRNEAVLKFTIDAKDGRMELRALRKDLDRFIGQGLGRSGAATRQWNKGLNRSIQGAMRFGRTIERLTMVSMVGFTASIYASQRALVGLGREFFRVNENFRGLEITLSSSLKSLTTAKKLTKDIAEITRFSPLPFETLAGVARSMSVIPAIRSEILKEQSDGNQVSARNSVTGKMIRLVERMSAFRPDQGPEGAIFAIREALGGELRSLIRRFDLLAANLLDLARALIGNTLDIKTFKSNPS